MEAGTTIEGADEALARAEMLLHEGCYSDALPLLEDAHRRDPGSATVRSAYGLCLGLAKHEFQRANELCESAVKQEFFNPDLYLAMARLHLAFSFKSDGIRYLKRGRMIDPGHPAIAAELEKLGARQPPPLRFLPRAHVLNRWLGRARSQLGRFGLPHAA